MYLFFDLDGTLIDISKRHHVVYSKIVRRFGGRPLQKNRYWQLKKEKTPWPRILKLSGLSPRLTEEFLEMFIDQIERPLYRKYLKVFPGTKRILRTLRRKHTLYLISLRHSQQRLVRELGVLGLRSYFKKIIAVHGKDGVITKTRLIRQKFGHTQTHGAVIGDTEVDIRTAKRLRLASIGVLSGIRTKRLLMAERPDLLLRDISSLPRAIERLDRGNH